MIPVHYENIWEDAEKVAIYGIDESADAIFKILEDLKSSKSLSSYNMGQILLHCCNFSRMFNINTFTALQKASLDKKSENLEKTI